MKSINNKAILYGIDKSEELIIQASLPNKQCEILNTDCVTDVIAVNCFIVIVRLNSLDNKDLDMLIEYYSDVVFFSETVVFIGDITLPQKLLGRIKTYKDFESLKENFKYILITAYSTEKKNQNFSTTLANSIIILSSIRKNPGITTATLATRLELSTRTVQRYIETLRIAGEWIEYDMKTKGWRLTSGKSLLFEDLI